MKYRVVICVLAVFAVLSTANADEAMLPIRAEVARWPEPAAERPVWRVAVLVRGTTDEPTDVRLMAEAAGATVTVDPESAVAGHRAPALFRVAVEGTAWAATELRLALAGAPETACALPLPDDVVALADLRWEALYTDADTHIGDGLVAPDPQGPWAPFVFPSNWRRPGVTWLRTRVHLSSRLQERNLALILGGADDADVAYLNGVEIGRGEGWNTRREYALPQDAVRWDAGNELLLAVDLRIDAGGFYDGPFVIAPAGYQGQAPLFPVSPPLLEAERARAGEVGDPHPLRPIVADHGVLRYADDGKEVALWGVNYYPPTPGQWESVGRLDDAIRAQIREDFGDLARMGVDLIRFHVFDTELTDAQGNIVGTEYLDKWDYLVQQCNEHGLYLMVTPIAVFGGRSATRPDSFSMSTPRPAIVMWQEEWDAHTNYIRQLFTRMNPYTGRCLPEEPCLALVEIVNEPDYWQWFEVEAGDPRGNWLGEEVGRSAMAGIQEEWQGFAGSPEWNTQAVFSYYRYDAIRRYIDRMYGVLRETGVKVPIAHNRYWHPWPDVHQAIADSPCDAVTLIGYTNITEEFDPPIADDTNSLLWLRQWYGNEGLQACYRDKARAVYEFEPMATVKDISAYPAMAKQFRARGAQIAAQFQYDPKATAHANLAWHAHYLNLWHAPERMISNLIGRETFHRQARGLAYPTPEDDWVFPPGAVSHARNAAVLCAEDAYMQARPTDWQPLPYPEHPRRILCVGSCPYFEYDGTGIVDIRIDGDTMHLRIYPDVDRVRYALSGTDAEPLTVLQAREHPFRLLLDGWQDAVVERLTDTGEWEPVSTEDGGFVARPGEYRLWRAGR